MSLVAQFVTHEQCITGRGRRSSGDFLVSFELWWVEWIFLHVNHADDALLGPGIKGGTLWPPIARVNVRGYSRSVSLCGKNGNVAVNSINSSDTDDQKV